ncbi:uncharacterized protein PHACADRAFT_195925 [Phanerochaete carnosa HHB-10118-sp]|uniref:Cytochrome P450 n=1 Tax=Phanerochaete carnosa (strain HHB-10118-sp) TaxID=650164 RepID=K5WA87_PHACS|nr:uncharacterized protein PHACADRAFT_195925 [Phanerochaete carnosa HHB-10118-sp]EKM55874.1 hypothetical protein PHACADRAFT_195925 [Phanerochaete carnosa HHB-10118-sp]
MSYLSVELVFTTFTHSGSDIIHLQALGMRIVVANSAKAVKELFEKRSHIYSDKQQFVMLLELSGWRRNWSLLPYGDYWREHRRLFHQYFRPLAVPQYRPKQAKAVQRFLPLLLDAGNDFAQHVRYLAGSLILDVVYAFDVQPGDPRIELAEKAVHTATEIMNGGIFLVDLFPILKHVPAWFPGARFKRQAAKWKALMDAMHEMPYGQFKAAMKQGSAQPCLTASLLSGADGADTPELDEIFSNITGTAYAGGSDTTSIALMTFIFAMVLYPEAQAFVQEELDRVVGRDRLPEIDDESSLPRVTAVMYETLRCMALAFTAMFAFPLLRIPMIDRTSSSATPHRVMADDEYNGYHIPEGSIIMGNSWAILHDEDTYPDPYSFNPKRFLSEDGKLREDVPKPMEAFGYGRRICPGRHFALETLFTAVSNILAVFTIEKAVDEDGKVVEVREEFVPHVFSPPKPFKARFKARYPEAESLIRSAALADA